MGRIRAFLKVMKQLCALVLALVVASLVMAEGTTPAVPKAFTATLKIAVGNPQKVNRGPRFSAFASDFPQLQGEPDSFAR
mgnify:CR=1 FL=1